MPERHLGSIAFADRLDMAAQTKSQTGIEPPDGGDRKGELRSVLAMSIPVVITMSSRAMMDVADYIMITGLGVKEAQAAILPAQMIMFSYIVLGMGIVSIVSTFVSQSLGRKAPRECGVYAWQSLYLAAGFGLLGAAVIPALPALIAWIGHEPKVQALEHAYARVAMLSSGPSIAASALGLFFIGVHRPWITMWSAIEANVINVAVSLVLIYGFFGIEPMGIAGAAWGTLAGGSYRTLRLLLTLLTPSMEAAFATRHSWRPSRVKLVQMLRVGGPCGFHWLSEVVVWAFFVNVLVGRRFGTAHLIATNTAWQYMRISFLPMIGIGQALTSLVGKSIGAGDPAKAMRETRIALRLTFAYVGTLSLIYFFWGDVLIGWFNQDAEVIRIGAGVMICTAVFQIFDGASINYSCALRGAGDTFWPTVFFIVSTWTVIIGGGWFVAQRFPELGSLGPWIAASTLIIITAGFLWWRWHSRAWMKIDIFKGSARDDQAAPVA